MQFSGHTSSLTNIQTQVKPGGGKRGDATRKAQGPATELWIERWGLIVVVLGCIGVFAFLPLGSIFKIIDDEGFEVIKAFMCFKGHHLYTEIWNDQPPLLTAVLTEAFRFFGPTILTARLVAAGFGLLLVGAFYELVRSCSGWRTALIAAFLLIAAPGVLLLLVAAMLEVPSFSLALTSALLLFRWERKPQTSPRLVLSGACLGLALQTKLTAALVLPALGIELFMALRTANELKTWKGVGKLAVWGGSMLLVFALIGVTLAHGSLKSSWRSHTTSQDVEGLDRPENHTFDLRLVVDHLECVAAAAACITLAVSNKRSREIAFPLVLLATAIVVHNFHRPWWNYYYLHFAIPIAWLAGWAVSEAIGRFLSTRGKGSFTGRLRASWSGLATCALAAFVLARSERRLEGSVVRLRHAERIEANPIVKELRKHTGSGTLVYSESGLYPFHARLPVLPELAIVMPKRFWSGQITTTEIISKCQEKSVPLIALPRRTLNADWKTFLQGRYDLLAVEADAQLYGIDQGRGQQSLQH